MQRIMDTPYSLAIIDKTIKELEGKKMGKIALDYIKNHSIKIIPTAQDKNVDNLILDYATLHTIVATQDKKLKEKLKKRKMGIIVIRQKRYLARI
jgi:rRNA-processing protein FCF1